MTEDSLVDEELSAKDCELASDLSESEDTELLASDSEISEFVEESDEALLCHGPLDSLDASD